MFAILQIKDKTNIFSKSKIESQRLTLPNGEAFFIVTAEKHFGRVPWHKLADCMGILRKDVVLSEGLTLPDGCGITEFVPDIFPRILLINSAIKVLNGRRKSLIVFDEKCIYQSYMKKLVNNFDRIRVVTPELSEYESVAYELMENYGFSLEVTDKASYKADVIISYECSVPLYYSGEVFTTEKKYLMNGMIYSGSDIDLPEEYDKLLPEGVDKLQFASALYEKCKEKSLGRLCYKDFGS